MRISQAAGIGVDRWLGRRLRLYLRRALRTQELRGRCDELCGFAPACDLQNTFFTGLHDVFVADPDNRIIFHCNPQATRARTGYAKMSWIVP